LRDKVWQSYKWQYKGLNEVAVIGQVNSSVVQTSKMETKKFLVKYPNVNTVLAVWDQFAHGAVEAITEIGKNDDISVYSIDVSDEVLQNMNKPGSPWKCTAGLDPWLLGNMSIQCAWSWLHGTDLAKYILLDPVLISQEFVLENNITNMKQLVKSVPELKVEYFLKKYPFLQHTHLPFSTPTQKDKIETDTKSETKPEQPEPQPETKPVHQPSVSATIKPTETDSKPEPEPQPETEPEPQPVQQPSNNSVKPTERYPRKNINRVRPNPVANNRNLNTQNLITISLGLPFL